MTRKLTRKRVNREQLHHLIDRLPEKDLNLAYGMLRRFISGPRLPKGMKMTADDISVNVISNEGDPDQQQEFADPALEEAFGFVLDNFNDTLKNLVNR